MRRHLLLGLIGDNIGASRAPLLHRLAGAQHGIDVTYDRLVPREMGKPFDALFDHVAQAGYRGINVTYPYKEKAALRVRITDPLVQAMGAVNTVLFGKDQPEGFNTDYSGFLSAYRAARGDLSPGVVLLIGAGGVGRSLAFALAGLGAAELRIADLDSARARALANALRAGFPDLPITLGQSAADLAQGVEGVLNATPVGMVGHDGTPLPRNAMPARGWAFDAVYTPVNTAFLSDAAAAGLTAISGYELFIGQGVDAWHLFAGLPLDETRLRADLTARVAA
ncbi:shikimate dehydrogenase [Seohaeicola sp. SP36]|uniref:shikimate dehydrogenase family protein n=1 Tax=unclassified Seohaeicola TaxID=2641111 RepID=UPI00237C2939|nr:MULTISPECIES: shikimate dehydrogenase [unclassified Seohaeicola]MDD9708271.1 shikimate dehydrogenase [Seohaeicola sp. 4SK31]MDD9736331.1 shikimate dehydrogenase [Seohaeicola sp. SP36]